MSESNVSLTLTGISIQQARELIATGRLNHPLADFVRSISFEEADALVKECGIGLELVYFRDHSGHDLIGHVTYPPNGTPDVKVTQAANPHPDFLRFLGIATH